jgi:Calx-beta domain-containing protein/Big-like domain-containing protein/VCBS repeat protein/FG-GAP repeat protein
MPVGANPRGIAAADFNGDGRPDIVTANNYSNDVTVALTDAAGSAASSLVNYAAGRGPYAVAAADLNGDGVADLAIANASNNNVSILLGTGNGAFGATRNFATSLNPRALAVADFNGDGLPDLVTANYGGNNISVLCNIGGATFAAAVNITAGTNPDAIVAADFNGDGFADVAAANYSSGSLTILLGTGAGTFQPSITLATVVMPSALAAADLNGDGATDLVVASFSGNTATVLWGDGTGHFATAFTAAVASGPLAVTVADFDGDGRLDIATASANVGKVSVLRSTGPTSFAPAVDVSAGLYARGLVTADFNGDGKADIAVANANSNDAWILLNTTSTGDLAVSINDNTGSVAPGAAHGYLISVSNHGPGTVAAALTASIPAGLTEVAWTCSGSAGASCGGGGLGTLSDSIVVPDHGAVVYALTGTVAAGAGEALAVGVNVAAIAPAIDTNPSNDSASDVDTVGVNHPPVAVDETVNVNEDVPAAVSLAAWDDDGNSLAWAVLASPLHGSLSGTAPVLAYSPAANFNGPDSFTFRVNDGSENSNVATVTIQVAPVNDVPTATAQAVQTSQDTAVAVLLTGSDIDRDSLTFTIVGQPAHGSLSGQPPNLMYAPEGGYSGADSFTFAAADGQASSVPAMVSITVTPTNRPPVVVSAIADLEITTSATLATIDVSAVFSDPDVAFGDVLSLSVSGNTNPALVSVSLTGATLTLGLAAGVTGTSTVAVRATDSKGLFVEDAFVVKVTRPVLAISIADASASEVNTGTKTMTFTVNLSGPSTSPVSVAYATADGSATAGADYVAASGTLTFAAGTTTRTLMITTLGDIIDEDDEVFHVLLSNPSGAVIADGDGIGTIVDNDQSVVSVTDLSVAEGNAGVVDATFIVALSTPNSRTVSVSFATADATAIAGADYTAAAGTLTFAPGVTSQTVTVQVLGDVLDELSETFSLNLTNSINAVIGRAKGIATIVDDDQPPSVTISDVIITEGTSPHSANVTLTLSQPSGQTVRVKYATADGTAVAGSDYLTRSGEIAFVPGVTVRTIPITILGDRVPEPTETLFVDLTGGTAVTIVRPRATITIVDDDS